MNNLHSDVSSSKIETVIKETSGFRLRMIKWESHRPKGLYCVNLIQEILDTEGSVQDSSTYTFHMTQQELQTLADTLTK